MSSSKKPSKTEGVRLGDGIFLKRLEFPAVYNVNSDELYRVDGKGFSALARCDGTVSPDEVGFPEEFLAFCLDEGVLAIDAGRSKREIRVGENETPSLRYLMVEVTDRCNLSCRHCYLGDPKGGEIDMGLLEQVLEEYDAIGGLRLIITGGEPLLYSHFERLNRLLEEASFRTVLLTNGTMIDVPLARGLNFDEVQVSLDGMRAGNDFMRGTGSFDKAISGIDSLRKAGIEISVATMIHRMNMGELAELEGLVKSMGATSWAVDLPCEAGRIAEGADDVLPALENAAGTLSFGFGSEMHEPSGEYACGAHLACIKVSGLLTKCGFYQDWNGGSVRDGLRRAWLRLPKMKLEELECGCEFIHECGGGCRFRAERSYGRTGPDPLRCARFGVSPGGP